MIEQVYQDGDPRYIVIEVAEAASEQFEEFAERLVDYAETLRESAQFDIFAFVPHSHQEEKLRDLFLGEKLGGAADAG